MHELKFKKAGGRTHKVVFYRNMFRDRIIEFHNGGKTKSFCVKRMHYCRDELLRTLKRWQSRGYELQP